MRGEKYESPNKPCTKGHTPTFRYVSNDQCVQCVREANQALTPEYRRQHGAASAQRRRARYPSKVRVQTQTLQRVEEWLEQSMLEMEVAGQGIKAAIEWLEMRALLDEVRAAHNYKTPT